jgi:hypothetical protein
MRWKVFLEQYRDLFDSSYGALVVFAALELRLHHPADSLPFFTGDSQMDASVRNYFNIAVREEQID